MPALSAKPPVRSTLALPPRSASCNVVPEADGYILATFESVSSTLILTPKDNRGVEIMDELETKAIPPFRWNTATGARSYWRNDMYAPKSFREVLDEIDANWTEHLEAHLTQ